MSDNIEQRAREMQRKIVEEEQQVHDSEFSATLDGNRKLEELQKLLDAACGEHGANADNARIPGPAVMVTKRFTGGLIVTWTREGSMLLGNFEDGAKGVRTADVDMAFAETIRYLIRREQRGPHAS